MTQRVVAGPGTQRHAGAEGTSASRSGRTGGVLPRAGLALAGCVAATGLVLGVAGPRVGGQAQGEVLVWVLCLPALVVVPGVLLRGRVGWPVVLNAALAMGAVVWLLVPGAVAGAHPTSTRLAQDVSALAVPGRPGGRRAARAGGGGGAGGRRGPRGAAPVGAVRGSRSSRGGAPRDRRGAGRGGRVGRVAGGRGLRAHGVRRVRAGSVDDGPGAAAGRRRARRGGRAGLTGRVGQAVGPGPATRGVSVRRGRTRVR